MNRSLHAAVNRSVEKGGVDAGGQPPKALLQIEDLCVEFRRGRRRVTVLDGIGFAIRPGEMLSLVGESGSGKSVTALTIMGLLPPGSASVTRGRILFEDRDLLTFDAKAMRRLRGAEIAMIFQEPMTSLNPLMTVGEQIAEAIQVHTTAPPEAARARACELLGEVGIADAATRLGQFPHEFSGGMRQRVMIAIGLACRPKLIIADEPTTALDVTTQAQILDLLRDLSRRHGVAVLLITHNLGIVASYADRVVVMYGGRLLEQAVAPTLFRAPRHPYTTGLLGSVPRLDGPRLARLQAIDGLPPDLQARAPGCVFAPRCRFEEPSCLRPQHLETTDVGSSSACGRWPELVGQLMPAIGAAAAEDTSRHQGVPLLSVRNVSKRFGPEGFVAVDDVSLDIYPGEIVGLVGESGCGKTTLGRIILRLIDATGGEITFDGQDLLRAKGAQLVALRRKLQVVYQDPFSSLNPRMTIGATLEEPLKVHRLISGKASRRARVAALLDMVGLRPEMAARFPHEMSGGQRQRVGIARALTMEPRLIICDEAVSALDVSIQAQVINLLQDLQSRLGLALLFIGHDLAVVRHLASRVAVMHKGRLVETMDQAAWQVGPRQDYTRRLMAAVPSIDGVAVH